MVQKKKRKKVHRATRPIFKNQLTRTKVFFIPGLILLNSENILFALCVIFTKFMKKMVKLRDGEVRQNDIQKQYLGSPEF